MRVASAVGPRRTRAAPGIPTHAINAHEAVQHIILYQLLQQAIHRRLVDLILKPLEQKLHRQGLACIPKSIEYAVQ